MTTKAQLLTVSAAAYESALAEHGAAQQEQQRIYDLLKVSDERCKAAIAAVALATQGLMLAAQAKAEATQDLLSCGDTVQLKSGGPLMTVDTVAGAAVTCVWCVDEKVECTTFGLDMLVKA